MVQKLGLPIDDLSLKANVRHGEPTDEVAAVWFKQLSKSQVRALFKMYEPDFELFGYNIEPFLSLARNESRRF